MQERELIFWADKAAEQIVQREKRLSRGLNSFRTESGIGASGIPHIGSLGDASRSWAVTLALRDQGQRSELIAYADDRDGLRKVPAGFPNELEKYIGKPVSEIPDPFKCHDSYSSHMSSLLKDALEKLGIDFSFQSGTDAYKTGLLNEQVEIILLAQQKVKKIVKDLVGQDLQSVYFPVCEKCGRVYTTSVVDVLQKERKVVYTCDQTFSGKNKNTDRDIEIKGCGHRGEARYWNGTGKLAWKAEFAARWAGLKICFEAFGKDIADSVKVNDKICSDVLDWDPPVHMMYEMFLEKGGQKISKSIGNVFTPQDWLRFGSTQSLNLLMYKRFAGTRELAPSDIPVYMDEVDRLEKVWFGKEKIQNKTDLAHMKRLFEYIHYLSAPKREGVKVPYNLVVNLVKVLPIENKIAAVKELLAASGHLPKKLSKAEDKELAQRIEYASNWAETLEEKRAVIISLKPEEKNAIRALASEIKLTVGADAIQSKVFDIARANSMQPQRFFQIVYQILLGLDRGPRAGHLIEAIGRKNAAEMLEKAL